MTKYLIPIITFVVLNLTLLVIALYMPAIGSAGDQVAANEHASLFWGMVWASGNLRFLVWVIAELIILFIVAVEYLAVKKR